MLLLPIPLLIVAERSWTKRSDWPLEPKELAEDACLPLEDYFGRH
jgi:hypothetical protein